MQQGVIAQLATGGRGVLFKAYLRAVTNTAIGLGSVFGGAALGAIAAAVLVVNNLRDRERDAAVGKRTLAVLLGNLGTRILYIVLMLLPFGALAFYVLFYDWTVFVFFIGLAALPAMLIVATARSPRTCASRSAVARDRLGFATVRTASRRGTPSAGSVGGFGPA